MAEPESGLPVCVVAVVIIIAFHKGITSFLLLNLTLLLCYAYLTLTN